MCKNKSSLPPLGRNRKPKDKCSFGKEKNSEDSDLDEEKISDSGLY